MPAYKYNSPPVIKANSPIFEPVGFVSIHNVENEDAVPKIINPCPVSPLAPVGPLSPCGPISPRGPVKDKPCGPVLPFVPVGPISPCNP